MTVQNTGIIQDSEIVKGCILLEEKQCSGNNSKVCYRIFMQRYFIKSCTIMNESEHFENLSNLVC